MQMWLRNMFPIGVFKTEGRADFFKPHIWESSETFCFLKQKTEAAINTVTRNTN